MHNPFENIHLTMRSETYILISSEYSTIDIYIIVRQ